MESFEMSSADGDIIVVDPRGNFEKYLLKLNGYKITTVDLKNPESGIFSLEDAIENLSVEQRKDLMK